MYIKYLVKFNPKIEYNDEFEFEYKLMRERQLSRL